MSTNPTDLTDLTDRFTAVAPDPVVADWLDVQRRVRASRKRHLIAYALAAAFAIVLVGCTAVFGPRVVNFADSEPSPIWVFDELTVVRAYELDEDRSFPGFDEKQTRRIIDQGFASGTIVIDLTPLRGGGFCATSHREQSLTFSDGSSGSSEGGGTACVTPERRRAEARAISPPCRGVDRARRQRARRRPTPLHLLPPGRSRMGVPALPPTHVPTCR